MRSHLTPRRGSALSWSGGSTASRCRASSASASSMGGRFRIDASTLDPRPDTETLIEAALALVAGRARRRSSSSISARAAAASSSRCWRSCRGASGVGIDVAWGRLSWRGPMRRSLVSGTVRPSSLPTGSRPSRAVSTWWLPTRLISSAADMAGLSPEVRDHDPEPALDGGPDGLSAYRRIVPGLRKALRPGRFRPVRDRP